AARALTDSLPFPRRLSRGLEPSEVVMADGGRGRDGGRSQAAGGPGASLRVVKGSGAGRGRPRSAAMPGEVAARLSALERRVEEALAESGVGGRPDHATIRALVDGTFTAIARARRFGVSDAVTTLRGTVDAAVLRAVVLRAAYQYWWRVRAIGLARVPAVGPVVLAVNRSGALIPWEALMLDTALGEHALRADV